MSKMWYLRGKTYIAINDNKDKFKSLDADAAEKAYISFLNCIKTDKDNVYSGEVNSLFTTSVLRVYDKGIESFNNKEFDKAMHNFNIIFDAFPYDKNKMLLKNGIAPDSLTYDLYTVAKKIDQVKAKEYLQKLIDVKYKKPSIYLDMSRLMLEEKDTAKALSYIEAGRGLFDDNTALITAELDIYIAQKRTDVLLEKLAKAIEVAPDNEILYLIQGTIYEKKNETAKAEQAYKKAIELKPDFFEANYNLGALYNRRGEEWKKKVDNLPINQLNKATEYETKRDTEFKNALPYLEKAHELNAADGTVVKSLLYIYRITGDNDKYNKLKAEKAPK